MSNPEKIPCRLFVILARKADKAVILRRGPSNWVRLILWDTKKDTFTVGQWFKGRVYEYRCDLSPDGSLFIYFAHKMNRRTLSDQEYTYAWTAISKPPYFTALALWPKGDSWHGGGLFTDDRTVWLNHHPKVAVPHPNHRPKWLKIVLNPWAHGEDSPIYYRRLKRDGWNLLQSGEYANHNRRYTMVKPYIWEKWSPDEKQKLTMQLSGIKFGRPGGYAVYEYTVSDKRTQTTVPIERATWADWDRHNRLVFVRDGQLFAVPPGRPVEQATSLQDFNDQRPVPTESPAWAKEW